MKPIKEFNINICRTEPEQVLKNKNDIEGLQNKEATDISSINESINTINEKLVIDEENISKNANNIASNSYEISVLKTKVSSNTQNIKTNAQAINEVSGIASNANVNANSALSQIVDINKTLTNQVNEIDALDNRMVVVEDILSEQETTIDLIRNGSIAVGEAENVNNLLANYLTTSSSSEDVQKAYDDFINKKIPIYLDQDSRIFPCVFVDESNIIFWNLSYLIGKDLASSEGVYMYPKFIKNNNNWEFLQIDTAIGFTVSDLEMSYTGFQEQYGVEIHFNLQSKYLGFNENIKTINYLETLGSFSNDYITMYTIFINGYVIYNGTGFFPILSMTFAKSTGIFRITYSENGNYKVVSGNIKDSELSIDSELTYPYY